MAIVGKCSGTVTIEVCLKFEHAVFVKIKYFLFRSVYAKNQAFFTNRKHAPNEYIFL